MSMMNNLTAQKQKEAEAAALAAEKAADKQGIEMRIAAAFDAAIGGIALPKLPLLVVHALYGRVASLNFSSGNWPNSGVDVGLVMQLAEAFPPVDAALCKGTQWTSWMSTGYFRQQLEKPEGQIKFTEIREESPVIMTVERLDGRHTLKVHWIADLDGLLVEFCVEVSRPRGAPMIDAVTRYHNDILVEVRNQRLVLSGDLSGRVMPKYIQYASGGSTSFGQRLLYGGQVVTLLQHMARLDDGYHQAALEAYNHDKLNGLEPAEASTSSGNMHAGSKAQRAELDSLGARRDRALAQKHWALYAKEHGLERGQYGFDYHAWAKNWLAKAGLQPDPNYLRDGKPYSYGSAWVKDSDE